MGARDGCPPRQRGRNDAWQGTAQVGGSSEHPHGVGEAAPTERGGTRRELGGTWRTRRGARAQGRARRAQRPLSAKPWGEDESSQAQDPQCPPVIPSGGRSLPSARPNKSPRWVSCSPAPLGCSDKNNPPLIANATLPSPLPTPKELRSRLWLRSSGCRCCTGTGQGAKAGRRSPWGQVTEVPGGMEAPGALSKQGGDLAPPAWL